MSSYYDLYSTEFILEHYKDKMLTLISKRFGCNKTTAINKLENIMKERMQTFGEWRDNPNRDVKWMYFSIRDTVFNKKNIIDTKIQSGNISTTVTSSHTDINDIITVTDTEYDRIDTNELIKRLSDNCDPVDKNIIRMLSEGYSTTDIEKKLKINMRKRMCDIRKKLNNKRTLLTNA